MSDSSKQIIEELLSMLFSEGYTEASPTIVSLRSLHSATCTSSSDYTVQRASTLHRTSTMLRSLLLSEGISYSDKANVLRAVAPNYLKLVHAFKTDGSLWGSAQTDLVPVLLSASSEDDIDSSIDLLVTHLTRYIDSLSNWLPAQ